MLSYVNSDRKDSENNSVGTAAELIKDKENIKWHHKFLLNRPLKVIASLLFLSIILPITFIYFFHTRQHLRTTSSGSCMTSREARLPCGNGDIHVDECHTDCCYDPANNFCFHRFPSRFSYLLDQPWNENITLQPSIATEPFGFSQIFTDIKVSIDEVSRSHLSISFYNSREVATKVGNKLDDVKYNYEVIAPQFDLKVYGEEQGLIFDTMRGPFIAANNIWEMSFKLTNDTMFGLGELPLTSGTVKVFYNSKDTKSTLPLIFAKSNGSYHGLLLDILAPTEVTIMSDSKIVVRAITKTELKMHLFVGPKPEDIMRDVLSFIGSKNKLEYWMLGLHMCSRGQTYEQFTSFLSDATSLPYESHCGPFGVMFNNEDNVENINNAAVAIKNAKKKFIPRVSPYIQYHTCEEADYIENSTECTANQVVNQYSSLIYQNWDQAKYYIGSVEGINVVYPNYENESSVELIGTLWKSGDFDALILENDWPIDESVVGLNETSRYLPYFSKHLEKAFLTTPHWNITDGEEVKYMITHNKYAENFQNSVQMFFKNKPVFPSSHWMKENIINRFDVRASWADFHKEFKEVALKSISGHWLTISPICGDSEDFDVKRHRALCLEWYKAAAFLPLIKVDSFRNRRDPLVFSKKDETIMIKALNIRLSFLPYIFTVLQEGPLLRPMFYQYPNVEGLELLTSQYNVGDDLLIVPDFLPDQSHVQVTLPVGVWYEIWSGQKFESENVTALKMSTTEADFVTFLKAGSIIFLQQTPESLAEETRLESGYTLKVALDCDNITETESDFISKNCTSSGKIYLTEESTIFATIQESLLVITTTDPQPFCSFSAIGTWLVEDLYIFGLDDKLNNFDNFKYLKVSIDLCLLTSRDSIKYDFIDNAMAVLEH